MLDECLDSDTVASGSQPGDLRLADRGNDGVLAELLPQMDIGNVDFDDRDAQRGNGITDLYE